MKRIKGIGAGGFGVLVCRAAPWLAIAGFSTLSACGSGPEDSSVAGTGGQAGGSGGSSGSGGTGGSAAGTGGSSGGATCPSTAGPGDGQVARAFNLPGSFDADDVDAVCDGSFIATGQSTSATSFERADGSRIELARAPVWIARFNADGRALWANAILAGPTASAGRWAYTAGFPDGSAVVGGLFGTSVEFDAGGSNAITLKALRADPEAYIARYAADGSLRWAKHVGAAPGSFVYGIAAGPNNTTFAAIATEFSNGLTIGAGEIDFALAQREGALAQMDADGRFLRASRYVADLNQVRVGGLSDGGALLVGVGDADSVFAKGTPEEARLPRIGIFCARYDANLKLMSLRVLDAPANANGAAVLPDGSVVVVGRFGGTLTLGAGEPKQVTFTNSDNASDGFVARFDPEGHLAWAAQLSGQHSIDAETVAAMPDGAVWISADYARDELTVTSGSAVIGPGTPEAITLVTSGRPGLLVRFTAAGKPAWAVPLIGANYVRAIGIAATPASLIALGQFDQSVQIGAAGPTLTAESGQRVFIAKIGP